MKLEVGKTYKTRDGLPAKVTADAGNDPFGKCDRGMFAFSGYIEGIGYATWRDHGGFAIALSPFDLVAEYVEPKKYTKDVYFYEGVASRHVYATDTMSFGDGIRLIGFKQITITEGEGLLKCDTVSH